MQLYLVGSPEVIFSIEEGWYRPEKVKSESVIG
jgi:hypothetical protein